MKITFFGLTLSSAWANGHATPLRAILRALHRAGHSITFFEKDLIYYAQHRDLASPDFCDIRYYEDWLSVRHAAMACAGASDVVVATSFLPDGIRVLGELLAQDRPLRVLYDLDTPVTLGRLKAEGHADYVAARQLREFDLVLSFTGGGALSELMSRYGVVRALPLYGCVDPDVHFRRAPVDRYASQFSYLGTYSEDRQDKLDTLFFDAARRLPMDRFLVAGSMFPEGLDWPPNVWYKPHLPPGEHPAFYSSSRATLNITRGAMAAYGHCPSGRFFEAAACATPLISDYFTGIEEFFDLDREIAVARTTEGVVQTLRRSDANLRHMAKAARERTLNLHTGEVRGRQMLAAFESARDRSLAGAA